MENKKHVFTLTEKKFFLHILKKYKDVVDIKDIDRATVRRKNEAWHKLALEYNASPYSTSKATAKQLRRLWLNTKQRQKGSSIGEIQQRLNDSSILEASDSENSQAQVSMDNGIESDTIPESADYIVQAQRVEEVNVNDSVEEITRNATTTQSKPSTTITPDSKSATLNIHRQKDSILIREYRDRQKRANDKHGLVMSILHEKHCEAKAKAELAELILWQKQQQCIKEYKDCQIRANEIHSLEMLIHHEQRREAKAKAEIAELLKD